MGAILLDLKRAGECMGHHCYRTFQWNPDFARDAFRVVNMQGSSIRLFRAHQLLLYTSERENPDDE
jgi:hypothetical protein